MRATDSAIGLATEKYNEGRALEMWVVGGGEKVDGRAEERGGGGTLGVDKAARFSNLCGERRGDI